MESIKDARLEERLEISTVNVKAKELTVTGQLRVEIPGRAPYEGVDRVEISYTSLDVEVKGSQKKDGNDILVRAGSVSATGYRSDPAVRELYETTEVVVEKDPHVVIYKSGKPITLNQVQGVPVVQVSDGRLSYK